jgi:hypothetical protein
MSYDNTNRWTLNKNDRKEKDTHPDYKGSLNVNGVDYWIDGWIKDGANGKFISGSLKPKDATHRVAEPARSLPASNGPAATSDSVPF